LEKENVCEKSGLTQNVTEPAASVVPVPIMTFSPSTFLLAVAVTPLIGLLACVIT
jgi:hypothetical protein